MDTILCSPQLQGDSVDPEHPNCMDLLDWSWGTSNPNSRSGAEVNVHDITVTKYMDKATPDLMLLNANGAHFAKLELLVRATCPADCVALPYYTLTMEDVLVTSVSIGGRDDEDRLTELVSFNFGKVKWCYTPPTQEGNPPIAECKGWDILANHAF